MKPWEIDALPANKYSAMLAAISVLEAQECLLQIKNADFAHLKKDAREAYHRQLMKAAFPGMMETKRSLSFEDLQGALMQRG